MPPPGTLGRLSLGERINWGLLASPEDSNCLRGKFEPVLRRGLLKNVRELRLDGSGSNAEFGGHRQVLQTARDQLDDISFARC